MGFSTESIQSDQIRVQQAEGDKFCIKGLLVENRSPFFFFSHWYIGLDHWAHLPGSSGKYVISSLNAITSVLRVIKVLSSRFHIVQTS